MYEQFCSTRLVYTQLKQSHVFIHSKIIFWKNSIIYSSFECYYCQPFIFDALISEWSASVSIDCRRSSSSLIINRKKNEINYFILSLHLIKDIPWHIYVFVQISYTVHATILIMSLSKRYVMRSVHEQSLIFALSLALHFDLFPIIVTKWRKTAKNKEDNNCSFCHHGDGNSRIQHLNIQLNEYLFMS